MIEGSSLLPRSYCLYATPRTGSTPVGRLIAQSLGQSRHVKDLGEFFNLKFEDAAVINGEIVHDRENETELHALRANLVPGYRDFVVSKRLDFLSHNQVPVFLKIFPQHCNIETREWIFKKFNVITLARQNLWDQLVSFVVAKSTNIWYETSTTDRIAVAPKSIVVPRDQFVRFVKNIESFYSDIETYKLKKPVYYEDLLEIKVSEFLKSHNLPDIFEIQKSAVLNSKISLNKIDLLANSDELRMWYLGSVLNQKYPI